MISHHRERGNDNGLDRLRGEYILTYQCRRSQKFNGWLLQNQMMRCEMEFFTIVDSSPPSVAKRESLPEDPKDLDHVSVYIHVHL